MALLSKFVEYMVVRFKDIEGFTEELDRKAKCGWKLHSWQDCGYGDGWDIVAVFERPAQNMTEPQSSSME